MRIAAVSLLALVAACASVPVSDQRLADRAADCSCAYSLLLAAARASREAAPSFGSPHVQINEHPLVADVGYFIAAGEALSTRTYVEARRRATLARWDERREAISREQLPRRHFLDEVASEAAGCAVFRNEHRHALDAAARDGSAFSRAY